MLTQPADCDPVRLMRLVREGKSQALDQITRCYGARLLAAGRRHCRTNAEAEDAVQDSLITAASKLPALRDDHSLERWLVQVVASACRRLGRGQKRDATLHDVDVELAATGDPEGAAESRQLGALVEQLLLELPARDRSLLLLAELDELGAAEIGAHLDMTAGAVRTRLSRLRRELAERWRQRLWEK